MLTRVVSPQSATGDTIVSSKTSAVAAAQQAGRNVGSGYGHTSGAGKNLLLAGIEIPEPVFFCTIEPPSMAKQAGEMLLLKTPSPVLLICSLSGTN